MGLIRTLLALSVVVAHSWLRVNRWLRVWPIYALVALACLAWGVAMDSGYVAQFAHFPKPTALLAALSNFTLLGQDWLFFTGQVPSPHVLLIDPPSWSLGVELSFYLVAPFVLRRRPLLIALLAGSLALRLLLLQAGHHDDPWSYRFFPNELAWFLCGALSQQLLSPLYRRWLGARLQDAAGAGTIVLVLVIGTFHLFHWPELQGDAMLLAVFVLLAPFAVEFQARHKWDRRIGDLSYPLYIGHYLVLLMVGYFSAHSGVTMPEALTALAVTGAFALAWALDRFVGEPLEAFRRKVKARQPRPAPAQETSAPLPGAAFPAA